MADDVPLQVLIPASGRLVAGLPPALRTAHRAAAELPGAAISLCGPEEGFARRFRRQLAAAAARCVNGAPAAAVVPPGAPLLVVSAEGFPEPAALARFVAAARAAGRPTSWLAGGRAVAAYAPSAALDGATAAEAAERLLAAPPPGAEGPGWVHARDAAEAEAAERALFAALPKDTDGYIARLDRALSMALSGVLLRWPVTPNDITTASLVLGLLGAYWLASGSYWPTLAGAALLWFCCLLDGCDGEVARLKLLCSPSGAAYDLWADHLAHLATFVALPIGVHRAFPQTRWLAPGALLVTGFLACGFSVWWLVLRKPESERGPFGLLIERVASRDYVYLILALALVGRLDWFVHAAAVGSHLFWLGLWALASRTAPKSAA
jgi:phosphatidylglycerophosphate synthase